jgi:protein-disulfide isomerase
MQNKKVVLLSVIFLLAVFAVGGYLYKSNESQKYAALAKEQAQMFQRPYSVVIGKEDAKVQLVEFFDPACETCAQFHPHVKQIMKENEGKIKLVLRYAPYHKNSNFAVKMLEGAKEQGKFMETLEFMFATQQYWVQNHEVMYNKLWRMLVNVKGLDLEKLAVFMRENKVSEENIAQDLKDAQVLGASKTPSYYVNGRPLQEFGLNNLKKLINSAL